MEHEFAQLKRLYINSFTQKKLAIRKALTSLDDNGINHNTITVIKKLSHSLSGSAGMYGMEDLSIMAIQLDNRIPYPVPSCDKELDIDLPVINSLACDVLKELALHKSY